MKRIFLIVFASCFFMHEGLLAHTAQSTIQYRSGKYQHITYNWNGPYPIVEGDILLGNLSKDHRSAVVVDTFGARWPNNTIPFQFAENFPGMRALSVLKAIIRWQNVTSLKFVERTQKNENNYPNYIEFVPDDSTICASHVGMLKGRQKIVLAKRCRTENIIHEIGHALGLWHEQSRRDRDNYIQIIWDNIKASKQYNFKQHISDGKDINSYDYGSIMHYGPYAFSKNGEKTIIPHDPNAHIGQRTKLSPLDIAAINHLYPAKKVP